MRFYILRNQVVVLASSAKEFGEWVETADRVVSHTQVADVEVSTVFLGIDHQFFAGPPLTVYLFNFAVRVLNNPMS